MEAITEKADSLVRWFKRTFWRHAWKYRNPYDRTCKTCGRIEVKHTVMVSEGQMASGGWWEVFDDGDEHKHYDKPVHQ